MSNQRHKQTKIVAKLYVQHLMSRREKRSFHSFSAYALRALYFASSKAGSGTTHASYATSIIYSIKEELFAFLFFILTEFLKRLYCMEELLLFVFL